MSEGVGFQAESHLVAVQRYAEQVASRVRDIDGIALGGSIVGGGVVDRFSDIDLFCYIRTHELPPVPELKMMLDSVEPCLGPTDGATLRRRAFLIEFRRLLDGCDTNVKFFTTGFMKSYINCDASMDEAYLEELGSYQHFRVLADAKGTLTDLLNQARRKKSSDVEKLRILALERYGKAVWNAVSQGLQRETETDAAILNVLQSVNWLLCVWYLMEGEYPITLKWRASERFLQHFSGGNEVLSAYEEATSKATKGQIRESLRALRRLEEAVAGTCNKPPWRECQDRWWWATNV